MSPQQEIGLRIAEEICASMNLKFKDVYGKHTTRDMELVACRHVTFTVLRERTPLTLHQIGEALGYDHATVLYGCKKVKEAQDVGYKRLLDLYHKAIGACLLFEDEFKQDVSVAVQKTKMNALLQEVGRLQMEKLERAVSAHRVAHINVMQADLIKQVAAIKTEIKYSAELSATNN
jgi:hypothetical protein